MKIHQIKLDYDAKLWPSLGSVFIHFWTDYWWMKGICWFNVLFLTPCCIFPRLATHLPPWSLISNCECETLSDESTQKLSRFLNEYLVRVVKCKSDWSINTSIVEVLILFIETVAVPWISCSSIWYHSSYFKSRNNFDIQWLVCSKPLSCNK